MDQELVKFKHLLEYFVTHLEYVQNNNTDGIGYHQYIEPILNTFRKTGQGYSGNSIQNQISAWQNYNIGKICINVQPHFGDNYYTKKCYLNWQGTGINIFSIWNEDKTAITELGLTCYKGDAKYEDSDTTYSLSSLGLYDNLCPNDVVASMFNEYSTYFLKVKMESILNLFESKKNIILQGAPGTGKTYSTRAIAENLCDGKYDDLVKTGRVAFTTFHQSMDYENFVEGLKPEVKDGGVVYNVEDGIFKTIADKARGDKDNNYLLIIDEINRGNISKILGELITLLEASKREGENEELKAKLPYSKEEFGVPSNLYILGTMNTTDRSAGQIDYAIRRRFAFVTLKADRSVIENNISDGVVKDNALNLFDKVSKFIEDSRNKEEDFDDLMVGHSYFIAETMEELDKKMKYEVLPLLKEYKKDGLLGDAELPAELKVYE